LRRNECIDDVYGRILKSLPLFRIIIVVKNLVMIKDGKNVGKNVVRIYDASKSAGFLELK
jgi:hypothetical protein